MKKTMDAYLEELRGKRILVLGLGISNRPLVRLLLERGLAVTACDKTPREKLDPAVLELEALGAVLRLGEDYLKNLEGDVVFRTPGLHPKTPEIQTLVKNGAVLTSEMEAFFDVCPCPIIAVTGSDGKTTTTTLIAELLRRAGKTVWLGGNIGRPLLPWATEMQPGDAAVLELSSFQLMHMKTSPQVAVVTNVAPNHLDIHTDMAEYVAAKENIFLYQQPGDTLVLNLDNAITRGFAELAKGTVCWFSRRTEPDRGIFFRDGAVWRKINAETTRLMDRAEILLPGDHNVENWMAAICAVQGLTPDGVIRETAAAFAGVEHRIERVRVRGGVTFYNDSIGTSPSRTMAGLRSFDQKVILIAGGYDKHIPYDVLGPEILAHVKTLILTGATAKKIRAAVSAAAGYARDLPIYEKSDFREAVLAAAELARPGDIVILSPASASYDRFKNFEERGNVYKQIVMKL